jgi:hypothetical protein
MQSCLSLKPFEGDKGCFRRFRSIIHDLLELYQAEIATRFVRCINGMLPNTPLAVHTYRLSNCMIHSNQQADSQGESTLTCLPIQISPAQLQEPHVKHS